MVRLKGREGDGGLAVIGLRFNSTMVRLKVEAAPPDGADTVMFQFHNGSIKSVTPDSQRSNRRLSFNSTMVRLKADLTILNTRSFICFNSTMVRLKDI